MSDKSAIEWTDATWSPITGCTRVSPGCAHCYIERTIPFRRERRSFRRAGNEETTGVRLHPDRLEQPSRWRRPRRVFVCSLSDLFHEMVPDEFVDDVFFAMEQAQRHTFQVLTKRPERALAWFERNGCYWPGAPLPNVWIGVSIENARYTRRADVLREIPAAVRFISAEPLLGSLFDAERSEESAGPVGRGKDLRQAASAADARTRSAEHRRPLDLTGIDWLIAGGESGGRFARPMHPAWARELRQECQAQGVAYFFKQHGSWRPLEAGERVSDDDVWLGDRGDTRQMWSPLGQPTNAAPMRYAGPGAKSGGRELDGRTWDELPTSRVEARA